MLTDLGLAVKLKDSAVLGSTSMISKCDCFPIGLIPETHFKRKLSQHMNGATSKLFHTLVY